MFATLRVFLLALASAHVEADEIRCVFDGEAELEYDQIDHGDGGVSIEFFLPRSRSGRLHRVDLSYGKPEMLFTQVQFEEVDKGYRAYLSVERGHQPVRLLAIYHHGGCFSSTGATIVDGEVALSKD